MRVSSFIFSVVVAVLVISLLCVWFFPSIEDFMATNSMWNGIKTFQQIFGAKPIHTLDDLPVFPDKTTLVSIPYLPYTNKDLSNVKRFVDGGGTLLLMDDYGFGNQVLTYLGMQARFSNNTLLDPLFDYKNQTLPRITDFSSEVEHLGITVITLNHATILTNVTESNETAWSSAASFLDINENGVWTDDEPKGPFPVAAQFRSGKGTVALVAEPSIIISGMMNTDNNTRFLDYMISPKGEPREVLFDTSHLTKTPLDMSKQRLLGARDAISSPYALAGITAMIFGVVAYYNLRKEEVSG